MKILRELKAPILFQEENIAQFASQTQNVSQSSFTQFSGLEDVLFPLFSESGLNSDGSFLKEINVTTIYLNLASATQSKYVWQILHQTFLVLLFDIFLGCQDHFVLADHHRHSLFLHASFTQLLWRMKSDIAHPIMLALKVLLGCFVSNQAILNSVTNSDASQIWTFECSQKGSIEAQLSVFDLALAFQMNSYRAKKTNWISTGLETIYPKITFKLDVSVWNKVNLSDDCKRFILMDEKKLITFSFRNPVNHPEFSKITSNLEIIAQQFDETSQLNSWQCTSFEQDTQVLESSPNIQVYVYFKKTPSLDNDFVDLRYEGQKMKVPLGHPVLLNAKRQQNVSVVISKPTSLSLEELFYLFVDFRST